MSLDEELRAIAGTGIFGVADAREYGSRAPEGHRPSDYLESARSIVVMGTRMLDMPLDRLPATRAEYTANFHVVNALLNEKLFGAAGFLEERGFDAFPVPYKENPGWNLDKRSAGAMIAMRRFLRLPGFRQAAERRARDVLSYRHMAEAAGIGRIGVSNLLLTPEHGPRVRLVALVTDAELEPGRPLQDAICDPASCRTACVRSCPARALREDGSPTDKARCLEHYIRLGVPGHSGVRCGLCVARCPANRAARRAQGESGRSQAEDTMSAEGRTRRKGRAFDGG